MDNALGSWLGEALKPIDARAKFYFEVLDRAPVSIAISSWNGRISYANRMFLRLFNLSGRDIENGQFVERFIGEKWQELRRLAAVPGAAMEEGIPVLLRGKDFFFRVSLFEVLNHENTSEVAIVLEALDLFANLGKQQSEEAAK